MTHHRYISFIAVSGLIAWVAWLIVIFKLDPYLSMNLALSLFFITFFLALSATFTVVGFYFRVWLFKNEIFFSNDVINGAFP